MTGIIKRRLPVFSTFIKTLLDDASASAALTTLGVSSYAQTILDDTTASAARTTLNVPIDGYLYGLTLSNNATDATNDIDIATGVATDSTNAVMLRLSSGLTKRLDASWSVGTGNGGLDTGSIANTTYYVWLIKRSDTGVVDALFSTSATSPTMPTNYDYKRRIGCIIRSAGAILAFAQQGDHFLLQNAISEYAAANPGTSVVTVTMTGIPAAVPSGELEALFNFTLYDGSPAAATYCLINNAQVTTTVPSSTNNNLQLPSASGGAQVASVLVRMPPSGQGIRFRLSNSDAGIIVRLLTYGWVDYRGKPG